MNPIERFIYNALKRNPCIKNAVVDLYQRLLYLVPVRSNYYGYNIGVREGYFFGFHDKCPWSSDNQFILAHRYGDAPLRMPQSEESIEVGFFSGTRYDQFHVIGATKAWNWQMGAMLQWIGNKHNIIFNDFDGTRNVARIVSVDGVEKGTLSQPVAAVSPNGKYALSHSFERMRIGAPGYEYANGRDDEEDKPIPDIDGLYLISIQDQKIRKLFSISDIVGMNPTPCMKDAYHFFSHCQFAPTGKRFVFYHRWLLENGVLRTRMISSNLDGEDLYIFPTSGMVSHMCWRDDSHVLAYASMDDQGDKYYLFTDRGDTGRVIGMDHFKSDGHPQFSNDRKRILTDTYPDRFRRQSLLVYDMEKDYLQTVLNLRIPLQYRYSVRCDFHPRWNRDATLICFDSAHTGKRALCILGLNMY